MRATTPETGSLGRAGYLVVPMVVWLTAMVALAGGFVWVQHRSEQAMREAFGLRVAIGADFAAGYVADQLTRNRRQGEEFLSGPAVSSARLREVSAPFGYTNAVLLDSRGRLIQVLPARSSIIGSDLAAKYDHLRTAVTTGRPAVSRVVRAAADDQPVVGFAVPFDTPEGRRVFSGGLAVQNSPLGSYLSHAISLPSSEVFLIDPDGQVVASHRDDGASSLVGRPLSGDPVDRAAGENRDAGGREWFYSARAVPGTPWRIVGQVPTAVLYAPGRDVVVWWTVLVTVIAAGGLVAAFDVARLRRNKQLLRESERQFREVFDTSLIGMAIIAPTLGLRRVNPALCTMLGQSEADLLSWSIVDITDPDDQDDATAAFHAAVIGRTREFRMEQRYRRADGQTVHATVTTTLLRDDGGSPLHFATQIVDVTERASFQAAQEASNRRLREAHERVEDLVAMLSHDVRQPLGVITGYTDTVITDWEELGPDRRHDFLGRVSAASKRMTNLVEDILALTQLDAGTVEPRRATVDVAAAVAEVLEQLPAEQAGLVTVHPPGPERLAEAVVDPGHLQQILLNLIGNAAKYGRPPIEVTVGVTGDRVEVSVTDRGEGVPDDFVPHLFERFARATTGAATAKKGTGLGLYIVDQLARANHADVTYTPNRPTGSCFTVCLTVAALSRNGGPEPIGAG